VSERVLGTGGADPHYELFPIAPLNGCLIDGLGKKIFGATRTKEQSIFRLADQSPGGQIEGLSHPLDIMT
jgi:hypothetical protein